VAGAALDVFMVEPAKEHALFGRDDVVCTPHLGASTSEAQENVALQVAEQMSDFLLTGAVTNAVNMPSVSAEDAPKLQPYMKLATDLGRYLGQLQDENVKAIAIEYEGAVANLNTKPLTACVLAGFLGVKMESVNSVSAPAVARERGIGVTDVRHDRTSDYPTLIRVTVESEGQKRIIAGSLFGQAKARIVQIAEVPIEAEFAPHMLYVRNQDKPGFIGAIGRLFGDAGINIASFHLGRTSAGADAICLIAVDQPPSETVLTKIRALPQVLRVRALAF
jgi:D-3-phosphoglycerate dehydrogenase